MNRYHNSQNGFALLPIIIAVAAVVLLSGSGVAVYQIQKFNEVETPIVEPELVEIEDQGESEPIANDEGIEMNERDESSESPIPTSSETAAPEVKAATTTASVSNNQVDSSTNGSETNVPLVVEQEFIKVYGRNPTLAESNNWKNKFRINNWSRNQLYNALMTAKKQNPSPSSSKKSIFPSPTPTSKKEPSTTYNALPSPVITQKTDPQEELRKQQIAQKKAELTAELNSVSSQLTSIGNRITELDDMIEDAENTPGLSMAAIQRNTAPLIAERNSLVDPYNDLLRRKNELIEQINLVNLM